MKGPSGTGLFGLNSLRCAYCDGLHLSLCLYALAHSLLPLHPGLDRPLLVASGLGPPLLHFFFSTIRMSVECLRAVLNICDYECCGLHVVFSSFHPLLFFTGPDWSTGMFAQALSFAFGFQGLLKMPELMTIWAGIKATTVSASDCF